MAVIDQIIPRSDVTGGAIPVLACQFLSKVHVMHNVLFDQDSGATIDVDAIRRFIVAICRIATRRDVVHQIIAHHSIAGLVDRRVGSRVLKSR